MTLGGGAARRARAVMELVRERAPAALLVIVALTISTLVTVGIMSFGYRSDAPAPILSLPRGADQTPQPTQGTVVDPVAYVHGEDDYGFSYPSEWVIEEAEGITSVNSPNGGIVVSFGLGAPGSIAKASDRLLDSIFSDGTDTSSDRSLIGATQERIGGSRSLIVSGTTTDATGRSIRFLAITVRSQPRNYSISVLVPRRSNPARVLPTIEAIVSSFRVLDPEPDVVV